MNAAGGRGLFIDPPARGPAGHGHGHLMDDDGTWPTSDKEERHLVEANGRWLCG